MRQDKQSIALTVEAPQAGKRFDKLLRAHYPAYGRSDVKESISCGLARVNGARVLPHHELRLGDVLDGTLRVFDQIFLRPNASVPFTIVHEGNGFLVIDKPAGIATVPDATHPNATLVHGLIARFPDLPYHFHGATYLGVVHRLERGASGLMVVATSPKRFQELMEMTRSHAIKKRCLALVRGVIEEADGTITKRLTAVTKGFKTRTVPDRFGKPAVTKFTVKERFPKASLLEVELVTGRTRQIRAHLASIGHPLVGDPLYLKKTPWRLMLHASELKFHLDGEEYAFTSPLKEDFQQVLSEHQQLP